MRVNITSFFIYLFLGVKMNILLLNGGKEFGHSHGELNHTLHKKAKEVLTALGHNVKKTVIDAGYDVEAEIEKFLWMDAVI